MSNKRRKVQQHGPRPRGQPKGPGKNHGRAAQPLSTKAAPTPGAKPKKQQQQQRHNQRPTIPFSPSDSILLVGEGDLSFARSLVEHHGCVDVTATVLEKDLEELLAKYPHAAENVAAIESSSSSSPAAAGDNDQDGSSSRKPPKNNRVLFGVDARKMAPLPGDKQRNSNSNSSKASGRKNRIIFNFPHVGGKSTDVNRQVRYNQELLVDFFKSASERRCLAAGGSIVVTLFEAEPYTLWNVKDLARHSGLQVERSFAFRADAYPGYHHARTLGVVRSAGGTGAVSSAAWKGEDRPARSYVFYRKGEVPAPAENKSKRKKRKRSGGESDEDDEDEDGGDGDSDRGDVDANGDNEDADPSDDDGGDDGGDGNLSDD